MSHYTTHNFHFFNCGIGLKILNPTVQAAPSVQTFWETMYCMYRGRTAAIADTETVKKMQLMKWLENVPLNCTLHCDQHTGTRVELKLPNWQK